MDKTSSRLKMTFPYSVTGKVRYFPLVHYFNTSNTIRTMALIGFPVCIWMFSKIENIVNSPVGYKHLYKRLSIYDKNKPFKTITEKTLEE